jgi:hypothetical protein
VLVKWETLLRKVINFLEALPEKDCYISEQSRRYWLLKEEMDRVNGKTR